MKDSFKKWFLVFVGSFTWAITMVKSGLSYPFGLGFWGANGHDGIWHVALAESLAKGNFEMPVFAGYRIQNYHIGFDLILGYLGKILHIPIINLYFQIIPPVLAVALGVLTYHLVFKWKASHESAFWATFLVYFGGSLGFIIGKGESAFWSQQAVSSLINPPFTLSLVLIIFGLLCIYQFEKKQISKNIIFASLAFGILPAIKIYAGILAIGSLLAIGLFKYLIKKEKHLLWVFFGAAVLGLLVYLPVNSGSASVVVWKPFWFLETMMSISDRVGWERFSSAISTYKSGHIFYKLVPAYVVSFIIFWVGNMGTRLIKDLEIFRLIKNFKKLGSIELFLISMIVSGTLLPMLFIQKGTPWNTIQFFYYSLFFSAIMGGIAFSDLLVRTKSDAFKKVFILIFMLLTLPTTFFTLKDVYIPGRPPAMLPNEEMVALRFLSSQPQGIVLTYPFDSEAAKSAEINPPRPLALYVSTAYVSAFSLHQTFLEDEINLDITNYPWKDRRSEIESWYKEKDQARARSFLIDNNIKYVYWLSGQRAVLGEENLGLTQIFDNNKVKIYKVD